MSDSMNTYSDLDSYGVWVKRSGNTDIPTPGNQEAEISDLGSIDNYAADIGVETSAGDKFDIPVTEDKPLGISNETMTCLDTPISGNELETYDVSDNMAGPSEMTDILSENLPADIDISNSNDDAATIVPDDELPVPVFEDSVFEVDENFADFENESDNIDLSDFDNLSDDGFEEMKTNYNSEIAVEESVDNETLRKIMDELSGLKAEIAVLKSEFAELKNKYGENLDTSVGAEDSSSAGGFFSDDDEDDTISLSGDELSNIMNSADFSTTEIVDENSGAENIFGDAASAGIVAENFAEMPSVDLDIPTAQETDVSDESAEESTTETFEEAPAADDIGSIKEPEASIDETPATEQIPEMAETEETHVADEISDIPEEMPEIVLDDGIVSDNLAISPDSADEPSVAEAEDIAQDIPTEEPVTDKPAEELGVTEASENAEESFLPDTEEPPEMDDLSIDVENDVEKFDNIAEDTPLAGDDFDLSFDDSLPDLSTNGIIADNMPDEISVPKIDDILVESSDADFLDSVKETDMANIDDMPLDIPAELPEDALDAAEEDIIVVPEDHPAIADMMTADPEIHESITDNHIDYLKTDENAMFEDEATGAGIAEETDVAVPQATEEISAESSDDSDRSFVDDLIDTHDSHDVGIPTGLKNEIKSVLLYMDQLLESLPEEKIVEFAQSEQFNTYKKLFSDLGLS